MTMSLSPTSLYQQIVALQEENDKLKEVRANMDNDLHELTANLFQVKCMYICMPGQLDNFTNYIHMCM